MFFKMCLRTEPMWQPAAPICSHSQLAAAAAAGGQARPAATACSSPPSLPS